MATWKKVVVSGSNAELNKLNVGANQQISSSVATTFLSGSFSGSFEGSLKSDLANANQANIVGYNTITGLFSYQGTGSFTATTASYVTGSGVYGPYGSNSILSASFAVTAAYASNVPDTASYALQALSASYATSASSAVNANTASYVLQAVSASFATKATTADSASFIGGAVTNNTDNRILTATGGGSINGESNLTFDGSTLTVTGNTVMTGDLTVAGTASFSNQTSLLIADRFILLASGSTSLTDAGIIASSGGLSGSAWYLEAGSAGSTGPYGRWATAFDLHASASVATPDEFAVTAKLSAASAPSDAVPPTWGSGSNGGGNIWVKQDTGDIYIWA